MSSREDDPTWQFSVLVLDDESKTPGEHGVKAAERDE
eukprot:COSAG02_NODE_27896_length_600_cov_1.483034_2_plen_36_part_01